MDSVKGGMKWKAREECGKGKKGVHLDGGSVKGAMMWEGTEKVWEGGKGVILGVDNDEE